MSPPTPADESYAKRLLGTLRGAMLLAVITLNTVFWATPIYVGILFKLIPNRRWRASVQHRLIPLAEAWISCNNALLRLFHTTEWTIRGIDGLRRDGRYLVNANHQSWADILVLQRTFNGVVPFLKFFIKQELIWVPVLGLAWWGLDFPFMKRYSSEFLAKHPELRGKDLETTAAMCKQLGDQPISIMNFLEGTRFTEEKRELQNAPYRYLLRPKAGGIAFVLGAIGGTLDSMLDVTIVYDGNGHSLWDFVCGRVRRVIVDVRERALPGELVSRDYHEDEDFRDRVQAWVRDLWAEKDSLIGSMAAQPEHAEPPKTALH
jgi:1-acyl-sn-glycerol-3-phosphate acyltransferase